MDECPICGRRLKGSICPYCDEEVLEEEETEATGVVGEALVEVFHCRTQTEADFITSLLESEGIPAFQAPGESLSGDRRLGARARGISVQVEEEDADRARDLVQAAKSELETEDK
jgi:hypothetical protein